MFIEWQEDCADALAQAIITPIAAVDVEAIVIDGLLPRALLQDTAAKVQRRFAELVPMRLVAPQIIAGTTGPQASAIGAAILPIYSMFAPDSAVLTKKAVEKNADDTLDRMVSNLAATPVQHAAHQFRIGRAGAKGPRHPMRPDVRHERQRAPRAERAPCRHWISLAAVGGLHNQRCIGASAVIFGEVDGVFSDACNKAITFGRTILPAMRLLSISIRSDLADFLLCASARGSCCTPIATAGTF